MKKHIHRLSEFVDPILTQEKLCDDEQQDYCKPFPTEVKKGWNKISLSVKKDM